MFNFTEVSPKNYLSQGVKLCDLSSPKFETWSKPRDNFCKYLKLYNKLFLQKYYLPFQIV